MDFTKCSGFFCVLGIVVFVTGIITAIVLSFKYVSMTLHLVFAQKLSFDRLPDVFTFSDPMASHAVCSNRGHCIHSGMCTHCITFNSPFLGILQLCWKIAYSFNPKFTSLHLCVFKWLVSGLSYPAAHREQEALHRARGVCVCGSLPLCWHCPDLHLPPANYRICWEIEALSWPMDICCLSLFMHYADLTNMYSNNTELVKDI